MDPTDSKQAPTDQPVPVMDRHSQEIHLLLTEVSKMRQTLKSMQAQHTPLPHSQSACPTPASPEVTPKSPYLEPMVPPPAPYSGNLDECKQFLFQCSLVFGQQCLTYSTDRAKIGYLICCLRDEALAWACGEWKRGTDICTSYDKFTAKMRKVFDHPVRGLEAGERLRALRQGVLSVAEYSIKFRILAGESGYNDCALRYSFLWGLNEAMQIELACRDEPESFEALVELAIRIDGRLQGRRRQRRGGSHVSTAGGFQRLLPALTPAAPAPSPLIDGGPAFLVERVLDVRQRGCDLHYLVEWEGHGPEERSWIPASHFLCPDLIQDFHRDHPRALRRGSGGPRRGGRSVRPQTRMVAGGACLPITGPASNDSSTSK
ncbi:uncharacterized protein LOC144209188 isoform X2 [Stigmatopora nigra]